jgi:hypothetical protein
MGAFGDAACELAAADVRQYAFAIGMAIGVSWNPWISAKDVGKLKTVIDEYPERHKELLKLRNTILICADSESLALLDRTISAYDDAIKRAKRVVGINPLWWIAGAFALSCGAVAIIKTNRGDFSGYEDCGCGS